MARSQKSKLDHWLGGTKEHESKAQPGPAIQPGRPKCPGHLCAAARIEFKRVSKLLGARGTETPGDQACLVLYSEIYSRWCQAKKSLESEGLQIDVVVLDSRGDPHTVRKLHPLLKVIEYCEGRLTTLTRVLGLTPVDRHHVKPLSPTEDRKHHKPGSLGWAMEQTDLEEEAENEIPS